MRSWLFHNGHSQICCLVVRFASMTLEAMVFLVGNRGPGLNYVGFLEQEARVNALDHEYWLLMTTNMALTVSIIIRIL